MKNCSFDLNFNEGSAPPGSRVQRRARVSMLTSVHAVLLSRSTEGLFYKNLN